MRFENQGLSLWYGTPDAPGPGTVIPAGAEVPITVGMSPADASNKVDVHYRINGGAVESLSASWFRNSGDAQYFTARLPVFRQDELVEFWATATCAGKYVRPTGKRTPLFFRSGSGWGRPIAWLPGSRPVRWRRRGPSRRQRRVLPQTQRLPVVTAAPRARRQRGRLLRSMRRHRHRRCPSPGR